MAKRRVKQKQVRYCACCGKIVNGHDIVRCDHVSNYVKKQGFQINKVVWPWEGKQKFPKVPLVAKSILMVFLLMFSLSFVSAQVTYTGGFDLDLTQNSNLWLLILAFLFATALFIFRWYVGSSLIILVGGLLMLFNGVNVWLSLIPIVTSVVIANFGGKG